MWSKEHKPHTHTPLTATHIYSELNWFALPGVCPCVSGADPSLSANSQREKTRGVEEEDEEEEEKESEGAERGGEQRRWGHGECRKQNTPAGPSHRSPCRGTFTIYRKKNTRFHMVEERKWKRLAAGVQWQKLCIGCYFCWFDCAAWPHLRKKMNSQHSCVIECK